MTDEDGKLADDLRKHYLIAAFQRESGTWEEKQPRQRRSSGAERPARVEGRRQRHGELQGGCRHAHLGRRRHHQAHRRHDPRQPQDLPHRYDGGRGRPEPCPPPSVATHRDPLGPTGFRPTSRPLSTVTPLPRLRPGGQRCVGPRAEGRRSAASRLRGPDGGESGRRAVVRKIRRAGGMPVERVRSLGERTRTLVLRPSAIAPSRPPAFPRAVSTAGRQRTSARKRRPVNRNTQVDQAFWRTALPSNGTSPRGVRARGRGATRPWCPDGAGPLGACGPGKRSASLGSVPRP